MKHAPQVTSMIVHLLLESQREILNPVDVVNLQIQLTELVMGAVQPRLANCDYAGIAAMPFCPVLTEEDTTQMRSIYHALDNDTPPLLDLTESLDLKLFEGRHRLVYTRFFTGENTMDGPNRNFPDRKDTVDTCCGDIPQSWIIYSKPLMDCKLEIRFAAQKYLAELINCFEVPDGHGTDESNAMRRQADLEKAIAEYLG